MGQVDVTLAVRPCPFCNRTGRCHRCKGQGSLVIRGARWTWSKRVVPCSVCGGTGVCQLCHGLDTAKTKVKTADDPGVA